MKEDDLFIVSPLDQPLPANSEEFLVLVEQQIAQAVAEKDPLRALNICKSLVQAQKISGLVLVKALYLIRQYWTEFYLPEGDAFTDVVYEYVGLHRHTIDRYLKIWDMYARELIPEEFVADIQQRNIKDQIPIANALAAGYDISERQWQEIAQAPDFSAVNKIVREDVRKAEPRKGSLVLMMNYGGEITGFSDGERYDVGSLNVEDGSDVVEKAINRIVQNSGIIRY